MSPRPIARLLVMALLFASPVTAQTAQPAQPARSAQPAGNPRDQGPKALVITYHVAPRDRLAFRRAVETPDSPLAQLKASGKVRDYQMLWNRYVDDQSWTMTTFIQFASPADLAGWRAVEASRPAGLAPAALALTTRIETAPADLIREADGPAVRNGPAPVYLVVPYDYLIGTDAYTDYVDGYVVKQMDGWIREGVLAGYRFYLARYGTVRPWSSMLLLRYRGDAGLGMRDAVVARVRQQLQNDPAWVRLAASKDKIREERTPAIADPLPTP